MHKNNFDFLRLLFALFVVITHSYAVTGSGDADPLFQATNGQMNLGAIGVKGFFIISGYLVFESLKRSKDAFDFMAKRVLRIFPGLVVVLLVTSVVGVLVTNLTLKDYFNTSAPLEYIYSNLALGVPQSKHLPGVFTTNPDHFVNSPLWTIPYEWLMYVILSVLFIVRKYFVLLAAATVGLLLSFIYARSTLHSDTLMYLPGTTYTLSTLLNFAVLFFSGSLLAVVKATENKYKVYLLAASVLLSVLLISYGKYSLMQYLAMPPLVILFGSFATPGLVDIKKIGDLSYGVYLYGFVVQQLLVFLFGLGLVPLMLTCIQVTILCAYCSWHFVEKKALKYKGFSLRTAKASH